MELGSGIALIFLACYMAIIAGNVASACGPAFAVGVGAAGTALSVCVALLVGAGRPAATRG